MNPKHQIYIVSKGRSDLQLTSRTLQSMDIPHNVVVESQELELYKAKKQPLATLLVLDRRYLEEYDTCDELGDTKSRGPGSARNFVWDHSVANGDPWHWVMDDNIRGFLRLNKNLKIPIADGTGLRLMEDFVERYENVAMAGPHYDYFAWRKAKLPPFMVNRRIYSCNLMRNDTPYRWRGRYNEDTDLSLRMLKDRWCTVLFYAFLQEKISTQVLKGGNTKEFYEIEGTLPKSQMQVTLHPDVSKLVQRYGRWHHDVDYSGFRHRLKRREGLEIPSGVNEFGMIQEGKIGDQWVPLVGGN